MGKPLAYILATEERPDDADNTLREVFGNEGAEPDRVRFAARFGCTVADGYGSTEGGASVTLTPDTPPGALGPAPPGTIVVDPDTGEERPRAKLDAAGRLLNGDEAIGELVSTTGRGAFEGYYKNDDAETPSACATAGTGPATSRTSTSRATCGSPAAAPSGCASTARTSAPPPSSACWAATRMWCWPPSTACPIPSSAIR